MAQTFYARLHDGGRAAVEAWTLEEYEAAGGVYSDAGNGGDDVNRDEFIGALYIPYSAEASDEQEVLRAIGAHDIWCDTTLPTTYLYREYPESMPLEARCQ